MEHASNIVAFRPVPMPDDVAAVMADHVIESVVADVMAEISDDPLPEAAGEPDGVTEDDRLLATPPVFTEEVATALVSRAELAAAVAACERVVERRSTIPILGNVSLKAVDGQLLVTGTDLDVVISAPVSGGIDPTFATTLPAHMLLDVLKKAKASDMVAIDIKRTVESGHERSHAYGEPPVRPYTRHKGSDCLDFDGLRVKMTSLPPSDFPTMNPGKWSNTFTVPTADLLRALGKVQMAISTEETRYYLCGVYMHTGAGDGLVPKLKFTATDGHRLGHVEVAQPDGCGYMPGVIVPRKTVTEIIRIAKAKGAPAGITVRVNQAKVQFEIGNVTVLSKAIDGTYPDYSRVMPLGNDKRLVIERDGLIDAVKAVTCLSSERGRAVRLDMTAGNLRLTVSNPDSGNAETDVPAEYDSDPMQIGFNARYLLDILAEIDSDAVEIMLADPGSPSLIRGRDKVDAGALFVLMPMRV